MNDERRGALRLVGRNLGREMEARSVAAADLADATGLPEGRIDRIRRAEVKAGAIEVMRLAAGLGARPEDLVGDLWGDFETEHQQGPAADDGRPGERTREE